MIAVAEKIQTILAHLSQENISSSVNDINNIMHNEDVSYFNLFAKSIFNILPCRSKQLNVFAQLLKQVSLFNSNDYKSKFIKMLENMVSQSNNEITSIFLIYLYRAGTISSDDIFSILNNVLKNAHKLSNDIFNQIMICLTEGSSELSADNLNLLEQIYTAIQDRYHVIQSGLFQDENEPMFEYFNESLTTIRENNWNIPRDFPNKDLLEALKTDNVTLLKSIVQNSDDANLQFETSLLNAVPILSFSPPYVSVAAFYDSINCLKALVDLGANLTAEDDEGRLPIQFAIAGGSQTCWTYLKKNSEVNFKGCLATSIEYWCEDGFNWLVQNIQDLTYGLEESIDCPFHAAAKINSISFTKKLIEFNIPHMTTDEYGWTPLHIAAAYDSCEVLSLILELNGTNINVPDLDGDTPLHCSAKEGCIGSMKTILARDDVDINAFDRHNATPLHFAAMYNQTEAIRLLLNDQRTNVKILDFYKHTALHMAAIYGSIEAAEILASDDRIQPNEKDMDGMDALHSAVKYGEVRLVEAVLSAKNIDIHTKDNNNLTAAEFAAFNNKPEILELLIQHGASIDSLKSSLNDLSEDVRKVLEKHFNS